MKMTNQDNNLLQTEEEEYFDLKVFFYKILARWWWFAISIPLCALIALYICFSSTPEYKVEAKVMISDSKKGEVGVNPMLKELGLFQGTMMVENEIVELKSKNLILDGAKCGLYEGKGIERREVVQGFSFSNARGFAGEYQGYNLLRDYKGGR